MTCSLAPLFKLRSVASLAFLSLAAVSAQAQGWSTPTGERVPEDVRLNTQLTEFIQGYPSFTAPYGGINSLPPGGQVRQTTS
ncbi:hypothetical protein, partial [Klebsiella aerogenes]|uniref:hypothetical protein n=1 Tax=Klebsiella aerogenes TaxID=548 RepID=UPI001954C2A1